MNRKAAKEATSTVLIIGGVLFGGAAAIVGFAALIQTHPAVAAAAVVLALVAWAWISAYHGEIEDEEWQAKLKADPTLGDDEYWGDDW